MKISKGVEGLLRQSPRKNQRNPVEAEAILYEEKTMPAAHVCQGCAGVEGRLPAEGIKT
ncbi:MAG: hypothetical protein WBE72_16110 [Terracidiphilus sp.]